jgi:hypothetical protein
MVFGINPARWLVKVPVPLLSTVLFAAVVGPGVILQQTPLAVTVNPPPEVTFPPEVAVVCAISDTGSVVTRGIVVCMVLLQDEHQNIIATISPKQFK